MTTALTPLEIDWRLGEFMGWCVTTAGGPDHLAPNTMELRNGRWVVEGRWFHDSHHWSPWTSDADALEVWKKLAEGNDLIDAEIWSARVEGGRAAWTIYLRRRIDEQWRTFTSVSLAEAICLAALWVIDLEKEKREASDG